SRVLIVACRDKPVLNWAAFELFELPAENILIKRLHCFRILRINFEVNYALHISILSRKFDSHESLIAVQATLPALQHILADSGQSRSPTKYLSLFAARLAVFVKIIGVSIA